jgi:uncharacterized protein GlcG (DUF336 family)
MKLIQSVAAVMLLAATALTSLADLPTKKVLTLGVAKKIAEAAEAEARTRGSTVVIAVVEEVRSAEVNLTRDPTTVSHEWQASALIRI